MEECTDEQSDGQTARRTDGSTDGKSFIWRCDYLKKRLTRYDKCGRFFCVFYRLCTKFEFEENMFVLVCVARWIWGVPHQSKMVPASHNSSPKVVCLVLYPNMRLYFYQCIILCDTGTFFWPPDVNYFPVQWVWGSRMDHRSLLEIDGVWEMFQMGNSRFHFTV